MMADDPAPPFDAAQGRPFDSAQGRPHDPVEEYFEQLDAAFAALQTRSAPTASVSSGQVPDAVANVPTLDRLLGTEVKAGPSLVAEAFAALLALEEGEPGARPVRLVTGSGELRATEALVQEVSRRVVERLASDTAREIVARVVSELAHRLITEEIERIRNTHV